jgi:apolipoprotein D and lipocalin family protein
MRLLILLLPALAIVSCTGIPKGIEPVDNFNIERYLGTWYEIARLDHSFERGLTDVRARYSLGDGGAIRVVNRGYSPEKGEWSEAVGKAYFAGDHDTGHLKVSFFGPFYSSYVIFELDRDGYRYAYVSGYSRKYLWLLARTPQVEEALVQEFLATARARGFDTGEIILVEHTRPAD